MRRRGLRKRSTRRRRFPRRRAVRRRRIGRASTKLATSRFEVDGSVSAAWGPNVDTFGYAGAIYTRDTTGLLKAYDDVIGPGTNARLYRFDFPLDFLNATDRAYGVISSIYDQVRVNSCYIKLVSSINPRLAYATPLGNSDFRQVVDYMPDASWVDYDGSPVIYTGTAAAPSTLIPPNGDVTNYLGNRYGLRRHRAFSTIIRRLKCKFLQPAISQNLNPAANPVPAGATVPIVRSGRPWQCNTTGLYTGSIFVAFSYKGQLQVPNVQPQFNYAARTGYSVSFRSPLFG